MSVENTTLTEVITIYEKLKRGRDNGVFRHSKFDASTRIDIDFNEAEETVPIVPMFNIPYEKIDSNKTVLDFNKYKQFRPTKYLYFSEATNLLQSDTMERLSPDYSELLRAKNYWLNIIDPNEQDFSILFNSYGVHDLTINDIREGNTEEKMEVYKHYTFFSLRLMIENTAKGSSTGAVGEKSKNEDVDFNIILFKDFIITVHDKEWSSITDILGFLNLLSTHSKSVLTPDWVLFSCFIEMSQDAKYMMDLIEPEINNIRIESKSVEMSDIMRRNFDMELQVYSISRFVKPKMKILRQLKIKCSKRLNKIVMRLLGDINEEFRELTHDLHHFNHILERSQDTFLAIVTSDQSREANEMSRVMKRISELALIFLPVQAIAGFFGMNVEVPFQTDKFPTQLYFWLIVGLCMLIGLSMYLLRTRILSTK